MNDEQLIWEAYQKQLKENMEPTSDESHEDPVLVKANLEKILSYLKNHLGAAKAEMALKNKDYNSSDISDVKDEHKSQDDYDRELESYLYDVNPDFNSDMIYQWDTDTWIKETIKDPSLHESFRKLVDDVKCLGIQAYTEDFIESWKEARDSEENDRIRDLEYRRSV